MLNIQNRALAALANRDRILKYKAFNRLKKECLGIVHAKKDITSGIEKEF